MAKRTLRGIRNDLGLNQEEMAKKLHVPLSSYQRYEQYKARIPFEVMINIADLVHIDVREIRYK